VTVSGDEKSATSYLKVDSDGNDDTFSYVAIAALCMFGCLYLSAFQYLYQVKVFKRLFDVDKFTTQSWNEKLRDGPGLQVQGA
jgi:hypothetical protein